MIVPVTTGGPSDIVARLLGDKLAASLGKQVVVDNRVGASQIIGSHLVAKADPDGYTLLQAAANMSINPVTVPDLPFDPVKDFAPVSMTHITPYVFIVSAQSPVKTLPELLKFIRGNPGKITYGATGPGSPHQLATLLLAQLAGGLPGMTEVQYKGSTPAHPDLIANRITFMIDPLAAASPHIKSGLAARAGGEHAAAQSVVSGRADRGRGPARLRFRELGRRVRPCRHAARGRAEAERRDRRRARRPGHREALHRHGPGAQAQHARGVRPVPAGGDQALARAVEEAITRQGRRQVHV